MTKVKLNDTLFEMSDDAALIMNDYIDRINLYHEGWKISSQEYKRILLELKESFFKILEKKSDIEKDDVDVIIENISKSSKIKLPKKNIIARFFDFILSIIGFCFKFVFAIIRICMKIFIFFFFLFVFFGVLIWIWSLIFIVPFLFFDLVIDWWHVMWVFPTILKVSLIWIEIFLLIFALMIIWLLFRKKIVWRFYWLMSVILLMLSINWLVYSGIYMYMNYSVESRKIENYTFQLSWNKEVNLQWFTSFDKWLRDHWIHVWDFNNIEIETYTWTTLDIKVISEVNSQDKVSGEEYLKNLWNTQISFSWDLIEMKPIYNVGNLPYKFLRRTIIIKAPENLEINYR